MRWLSIYACILLYYRITVDNKLKRHVDKAVFETMYATGTGESIRNPNTFSRPTASKNLE